MKTYHFNEDKKLLSVTDIEGKELTPTNLMYVPNCVARIVKHYKSFKPFLVSFDGVGEAKLITE